MPILSLNEWTSETIATDIAIVGGGACGLAIARALAGSGRAVTVLESGGLEEDPAHEALNAVESDPANWTQAEAALRDQYHRNLTQHWDGGHQTYGVRCRGLGGSTQAWAGKCAPFEPLDLSPRDWVPRSGWPVDREALAPFIEEASELLNLGPRIYDASLWEAMDRKVPAPSLSHGPFDTQFWQFARSRRQATDIMRFGADFRADPPADVTVMTHATVTRLLSNEEGSRCTGLEARNIAGKRLTVRAARVVLAASAVENARLMLMSRDAVSAGLGNQNDQVGRCLMDHPIATVARAQPGTLNQWAAHFGLFGFRQAGQTHVYMHGLRLSDDFQRHNDALSGAVFVTEERAPDDPFSAMSRLVKRKSTAPLSDLAALARSPVRLARGITARTLERGYLPAPMTRFAVNTALRLFPNTVAQDYQSGSMPVKLSGLRFEATTEQPPDPENRVTLSDQRDALDLPLPRVRWSAGPAARENLLRIGEALAENLSVAGDVAPIPEDWVRERTPEGAVAIDLGHSMGSTRMSTDPKRGVVDADCAVHGVAGLYIAGGSVLPTSGHANPTLMMLAVALRLADHLRGRP
ncbi:MAG: GMC family oxidoreductase [Sulfitobacter sp.]|nr:GMC family oxidoreductase [Sulfitobacter sp.]